MWQIIKTLYASKATSPGHDPNSSNNQGNPNRSDDQSNAGLSNAGSGSNLVNFSRTTAAFAGSESGSGEGAALMNTDQRSVRSELQSTGYRYNIDTNMQFVQTKFSIILFLTAMLSTMTRKEKMEDLNINFTTAVF